MSAPAPARSTAELVVLSCVALGLTQRELGDLVGASRRTVVRWIGGKGSLSPSQLRKLAARLLTRDPSLAGRAAATAGTTLEAMGLVAAPAAPAPKPAPVAPAPPPTDPARVDAVVLAVAAAVERAHGAPLSIAVARAAVVAAFERAGALGVTGSDVARHAAQT